MFDHDEAKLIACAMVLGKKPYVKKFAFYDSRCREVWMRLSTMPLDRIMSSRGLSIATRGTGAISLIMEALIHYDRRASISKENRRQMYNSELAKMANRISTRYARWQLQKRLSWIVARLDDHEYSLKEAKKHIRSLV